MFQLRPETLEFTKTAKFRFENVAVLKASPEKVFDALTDKTKFEAWFPECEGVEWLGEERGNGARRKVVLKSATAIEKFIVHDPGKRWTFYIESVSLPLINAMVEDYRLEAHPEGTRLLWDIHYEPRLLMRFLHPIARAVYGKMFRDATAALKTYLAA